jgi:hypothetical protein
MELLYLSLKRRSRADVLRKNDWVLMKRPGNIRGARLRWEGPYIFRGYKDQETKRQAVLEDNKGKKWYRASNQIRRYYPRLDFTTEYLDLMKQLDAQVPTGREIEQRFVEQDHQAPSQVCHLKNCRKADANLQDGGVCPSRQTHTI